MLIIVENSWLVRSFILFIFSKAHSPVKCAFIIILIFNWGFEAWWGRKLAQDHTVARERKTFNQLPRPRVLKLGPNLLPQTLIPEPTLSVTPGAGQRMACRVEWEIHTGLLSPFPVQACKSLVAENLSVLGKRRWFVILVWISSPSRWFRIGI